MNAIESKKLQRRNLLTRATALVSAGLTTQTEVEYNSLIEQADALEADIEALERIGRSIPTLKVEQPVADTVTRSVTIATPFISTRGEHNAAAIESRRAELNTAYKQFFLRGIDGIKSAEMRDIVSTGDTTGGALIPQAFSPVLTEAKKYFAPVADYCNTVTRQTASPVKFSYCDDRANSLVSISQPASLTETDPTFASVLITPESYSAGLVRFSRELMNDSQFDIGALLARLGRSRVGRGYAALLTVGDANNTGLLNVAQVGTTTAVLADGIGWEALIALHDSLEVAYLPTSVFQMHSKTRSYLLGELSAVGTPLYTPAPTVEGVDMLLGRPVVINNSLPAPTAGAFTASTMPVLFGSLTDAYAVADTPLIMTTMHERYAEFNEIGVTLFARVASTGLVAGALQGLKIAAA